MLRLCTRLAPRSLVAPLGRAAAVQGAAARSRPLAPSALLQRTPLRSGWRIVACPACGARAIATSALARSLASPSGVNHAPSAAPPPPLAWPPATDTVYQLSSGLGGARVESSAAARGTAAVGVAIIRISGPLALPLLMTLTRRRKAPEPRKATRCNLYTPDVDAPYAMHHFEQWRKDGALADAPAAPVTATPADAAAAMLDAGILCLYFPAPHSFTGEEVVELHVHGTPLLVHSAFEAIEKINRKLVQQIVDPMAPTGASSESSTDADPSDADPASLARSSALLSFPPLLRPATPGEFTRRAFHAGKLDLTQVEALADLLEAGTERQRDQALLQMRGALGGLYTQWRLDLVHALAYVEAILDFSEDEADVGEAEVLEHVLPKVRAVAASLRAHLADARRGELVRQGIGIALAGAPNAGKSTLLNALSQRNVAIVSPVAGTTRDIVENRINIKGWACVLSDTAGLRKLQGEQEEAGEEGDAESASGMGLSGHDLIEAEGMRRTRARLQESDIKLVLLDASALARDPQHSFDAQVLDAIDASSIVVWTKADLLPPVPPQVDAAPRPTAVLSSAAATGQAKLAASKRFYARTNDAWSDAHTAHFTSLLSASPAFQLVASRGAPMVFVACGGAGTNSGAQGEAESHRGVQQLLSVLERQIQRTVGLDGAGVTGGAEAASSSSSPSSLPLITRARHRAHVESCVLFLDLFERYLSRNDLVLAAEQLRLATREMGKITGRVDVEELLDVIFQDFCIGK